MGVGAMNINDLPAQFANMVPIGIDDALQRMDWADDEIDQAISRHPAEADTLFHSFGLLQATDLRRMGTEFVYRSHCREILERVARGEDTRPGTAVEVICMLGEVSQVIKPPPSGMGLYYRMWAQAFPGRPNPGGDNLSHYEALCGSAIDDLEATTRSKLAVPNRQLDTATITCDGRHHTTGVVQCKYARNGK